MFVCLLSDFDCGEVRLCFGRPEARQVLADCTGDAAAVASTGSSQCRQNTAD